MLFLKPPRGLRAPWVLVAHGPFGGGEADLGVGAVAEGFGGRASAAAQGDRGAFSSIFDAISVTHDDRTLDEVWPVLKGCDGDTFVAHAHRSTPALLVRSNVVGGGLVGEPAL
jgi:hypothetical protein